MELQHDIESAHFVVSFIIFTHNRYAPACNLEQLSWTAAPERPRYSRRMAQYVIKTRRQLQSSRTPQNWRSISLCFQRWITCWLPMYIKRTRLHVCDKWHVASWRHRVERGKLCSPENYWKININGFLPPGTSFHHHSQRDNVTAPTGRPSFRSLLHFSHSPGGGTNGFYSGVFKDAVVAYLWLLSEPVGVAANV